MLDWLEHLITSGWDAAQLVAHDAARVHPGWLAAGVVLHLLAQIVRLRGWFNILRAAFPDDVGLHQRHTTRAFLAGSGLNALVPARGGDVIKVLLVDRRLERPDWAKVVGTFVPESLFESLCGAALLIWALTQSWLPIPQAPHELPNLDISLIIAHPVLSALIAAGLLVVLLLLVRLLRNVVRRFAGGLVILRHPREFVRRVVGWQLIGRVIRFGSLACFMAAFALPVTFATVLLVMAAQGGGRIIPFGPVSAGLRVAMVSYGLLEITDQPIDVASITAFTFGVGAVLFVVMVLVAVVCLALELGTLSPRRGLAVVRERLAARAAEPSPT